LPEGRFVVGTVAHLTEEKNIALLCALGRRLARDDDGAVLACVGPCSNAVRDRLNQTGAVKIIDELREPVRYYSAFDVYVSTSKHEGLGTALLDAVVRDIPAVATAAGGTRDIFPADWELVNPKDHEGFADRVVAVRHGYRAARRGAAMCGRSARERFSVQEMVRGTVAVYERVLGTNTG
jgi:glycosyltransferase involved in cell wall biosynthesis